VIFIWILSALISSSLSKIDTFYEEKPPIPIDMNISNIIIEIGNQLVDFKHHAMVLSYRFDLNLPLTLRQRSLQPNNAR